MNSKVRIVKCPRCRRVLAEPPDVPVYECGGCGTKLQAKKRNTSTVDTASQRQDDDSLGKRKVDQVFVDQEAGSSSNQQSLLHSTNKSDQNSDHNDLLSSNKVENGTVDTPKCVVEKYSSQNMKMKQLSDNQEPCYTSNQQSLANSSPEPDQNTQNDPRSSTEFSGHEDPESSPEATAHNRTDQEQKNVTIVGLELEHSSGEQKFEKLKQLLPVNSPNKLDRDNNDRNEHHTSSELAYHEDPESSPEATDHDRVTRHDPEFLSCRNEKEFEEISSEFEETVTNRRIISDSGGGAFRSMIAEKLLDTKQKKTVYRDEDDDLLSSEDGGYDMHRRLRKFAGFGDTGYYGYEGSVSSFDGNDDQNPRKNHIRSIKDEDVDSGNRYRFNRHNQLHNLNEFNEFHEKPPRYRSPMIPENPNLEKIELLKLVRELQNQLDRTGDVPSYYNHSLNNPGRYGHRMAFSGEVKCHHCCPQPQDRRFSAQLPQHHQVHHVCSNGPNYGPNTYHGPRVSGPSSPKHSRYSVLSDFSSTTSHEDVHRRQWDDVTTPVKKKKQYVRPIAGGAPWITCYLCSKLLEMPQNFLLFNKRYHSLRCGGCLKVLNFTLLDRTHISRYYPEETIVAPPSSEVEDSDQLTGPWAGPVSLSDRSFEKSYSTETDRNGSREFGEERRKARDPSSSTRPPSSTILSRRRRMTSEIEEEVEPVRNGSPLHWLMGYASPSKVIRG